MDSRSYFCFGSFAQILKNASIGKPSDMDIVAMLFEPIVKKARVQGKYDEKGQLYEAKPNTANKLMRRKMSVNREIVEASVLPEVRDGMTEYFKTKVIDTINPYKREELIKNICATIREDRISDELKDEFLEFADIDHLAEFLSTVFLYSLSVENNLGRIHNEKYDTDTRKKRDRQNINIEFSSSRKDELQRILKEITNNNRIVNAVELNIIQDVLQMADEILSKEDEAKRLDSSGKKPDGGSSGKTINKGWLKEFFEACTDFSDDDDRRLWAMALAREILVPGSYSLKAIDVLKRMTKDEMKLFKKISGMVVDYPPGGYALFKDKYNLFARAYIERGVTLRDIDLLVQCGLLSSFKSDSYVSVLNPNIDDNQCGFIIDKRYYLSFVPCDKNFRRIDGEMRELSKVGNELLSLFRDGPDFSFFHDIKLMANELFDVHLFIISHEKEDCMDMYNYDYFTELFGDEYDDYYDAEFFENRKHELWGKVRRFFPLEEAITDSNMLEEDME